VSATARRPATQEEFDALRARLRGLSHEAKVSLATITKPIVDNRGERQTTQGARVPQTDDELHAAILAETGFDIPRVSVCEDHCAPFDPIADGFFNRHSGILILKSREAGGTLNVSILQYMKCKFIPQHEGVTFGSIRDQAEKAFSYVQGFVQERVSNDDGSVTRRVKPEIDGEPLQKRILWKIGSLLSIIVGTASGVNSPHPNTVHADEVDLMDDDILAESANMSSSTLLPDGSRIPALDVVTSTRKSMHGPMQKLIEETEETERQGYEGSWKLYAYCVAEVAEEVPCCRGVSVEQREGRLRELGRDPGELCSCDRVVKGEWAEDVPRTLESVCRGRFFRSRGWLAYDDIKRKFRKNAQATWDAQMECRRPMADGLYLPGWTRQRFTTVGWQPRPELGQVWQSVDWGGSAVSAVLWVQGPLRVSVTIQGPSGTVTVILGAYVAFDELLEANVGATKLADKVVAKEIAWRRQIPGFRVTGRFADMAGKQQRDDWREHTPPLRTVWYLPNRDFAPTVKTLQDLVADKRYWVDSRCSRHMDDVESWRQKNGREVHDESSHTMAASRYLHANTETLERRRQHQAPGSGATPIVVQRAHDSSLAAAVSQGGDPFADERAWRSRLGESFADRSPYGR
jgi:hypothetical protein